jgi:hypothetical protein
MEFSSRHYNIYYNMDADSHQGKSGRSPSSWAHPIDATTDIAHFRSTVQKSYLLCSEREEGSIAEPAETNPGETPSTPLSSVVDPVEAAP